MPSELQSLKRVEKFTAGVEETADVSFTTEPRDVVIILDSTASVSDPQWDLLVASIQAIIRKIGVGSGAGDARYAVFEFGNTKDKSLGDAVADQSIHFLVGSETELSVDTAAIDGISAYDHRQVRELFYDMLGPAALRAQEYLETVGRPGVQREIWAIHDMDRSGFPETGETGSQFDDAAAVKAKGTRIIAVRTLGSNPAGDKFPSEGYAFNAGSDISDIVGFVEEEVLTKITSKFSKPTAIKLSERVDLDYVDQMQVSVEGVVLARDKWDLSDDALTVVFEAGSDIRGGAQIEVTYFVAADSGK